MALKAEWPSLAAIKNTARAAFLIPVVVDDHVTSQSVKLTRCNYFSIESDKPSSVWSINLQRQKIPVCLGGLSGIIIKPLKGELFLKASDFNNLFSRIEKIPSLFVDVNEVWFPTGLFPETPVRGHIYRIKYELFDLSILFQTHQISFEEFQKSCLQLKQVITSSGSETEAFLKWEKGIIQKSKKIYPKNEQLKLRWN